jgi:hypothetical protein
MKGFFSRAKSNHAPIVKRRVRRLGFLGEFLLITSAIALSAGVGFGAALRLNRPEQPGSTIFHSEQSFPPRQDWPVSNSADINSN